MTDARTYIPSRRKKPDELVQQEEKRVGTRRSSGFLRFSSVPGFRLYSVSHRSSRSVACPHEAEPFHRADVPRQAGPRSSCQTSGIRSMARSLDIAMKHAATLEATLNGFVSGDLPKSAFLVAFRDALHSYANAVDSRPYYPLQDIAESGSIPDDQLRRLCSQAAERLPRELLDRSTRQWILDNLVAGDGFRFMNADGSSKFGFAYALHATPIERQSFLLSAVNGNIRPASFKYEELLRALCVLSQGQLATWALCSEPDGAFAHIDSLWSLGNTYEEPEQLAKLEHVRGDHVQWGNCYLLLLPADRSWLLVNRYNFREFSIELHAGKAACEQIAEALSLGFRADA